MAEVVQTDLQGFHWEVDMFGVLFNTKQMPRVGISVLPNPLVGKEHGINFLMKCIEGFSSCFAIFRSC